MIKVGSPLPELRRRPFTKPILPTINPIMERTKKIMEKTKQIIANGVAILLKTINGFLSDSFPFLVRDLIMPEKTTATIDINIAITPRIIDTIPSGIGLKKAVIPKINVGTR